MNVELETLFNRVADGLQSEQDERRLVRLLTDSAELRREFRLLMRLHSSLHWGYAAVAAAPGPVQTAGRTAPNRLLIAAAVVCGVMLAAAAALAGPTVIRMAGRLVPTLWAAPLATVVDACLVLVNEGQPPLRVGDAVKEGRIALQGGAVELRLRNGVTVVLEGPVDLLLRTDMEAFVQAGKVLVRMPRGMSGFRLETPSTSVLDLGTEFAVRIGDRGATDIQVYDGEVIATARDSTGREGFPNRLVVGDALRFSSDLEVAVASIPFAEGRFIRSVRSAAGKERYFADSVHAAHYCGTPRTESIQVTRPAAAVTIDGHFDDWPLEPGFHRQRIDTSPDDAISGWMMHDADRLYIAAHIRDPAPMRNAFDPEFDAAEAWRGGGLHVRLSTDRAMGWPAAADGPAYFKQHQIVPDAEQVGRSRNPRLSHLLMWYHAASSAPCLSIAYGMHMAEVAVNPSGAEGAFVMDEDRRGYRLEYAIPWRLLNAAVDPPQPGDTLPVSWQAYWSDESGRLWRDQVVEVRNLAEADRIFVFERAATWGRSEYQ